MGQLPRRVGVATAGHRLRYGVRSLLTSCAAATCLVICAPTIAFGANPRSNVTATPAFFQTCATKGSNSPDCIKQAVLAIEHARSLETMKKRALILPDNYRTLTVPQQTFVVTNLERVDRGLRPWAGLTTKLNDVAQSAAVSRTDPNLAVAVMRAMHVDALGSIWAGDFGPLASDYDWMYGDGYAGSASINIDCVRPQAPGCWGHRENILEPEAGYTTLSAGAGAVKQLGGSITEIFVAGSGSRPHYVYTWRQALSHGANGHRVTAG